MKSNLNLPGVIPWWTINGNVVPEEAARQLDDLAEKGVMEFMVYPNYGLETPDFLTEKWFDFIRWVIGECKKRAMHFWLYDELSWPSGSAGGRLCREHPEFLMRTLRRSTAVLKPGERWTPCETGDYSLITANGKPVSVAPGGFQNDIAETITLNIVERVLIEDHFFCSMGTSGTRNDKGIMDALNPDAVRCWMSYNYLPYAEHFPEELGETIRGFFFDEPTMISPFHTGDVPWTPGLEELFESRYGCSMTPHLEALFEPVPGEEQFRLDYWSLVSNRFADAFTKQLSTWCEKHHLLLSGHCWPEEPGCQRLMTAATGDVHLLQQHLHVPGTDMLYAENCFAEKAGMCPGTPRWARNIIYSAKHPASTARYNGARFTICETSGSASLGTASSAPASQKKALDFLAVMGIAIMNPARPYDMTGFRKHAAAIDAGEPYWKYYRQFNAYWERLSAFNRRGRTKTVIAVLDPLTTKFALTPIAPDTSIRKEHTPLPEEGNCGEAMLAVLENSVRSHRDFELIFEEVIRAGSVSETGELLCPESSFKVLILPHCRILDAGVYEKLVLFAARGGILIAAGAAPAFAMTPGGKGAVAIELPVIQLNHEEPDFAEKFAAVLEKAAEAPYTLQGTGADEVLTQFRAEPVSNWQALLLVNGTPGKKELTLSGTAADSFCTLCDLQTGKRFAWNSAPKIELEENCALLLENEPFVPEKSPSFSRVFELSQMQWQICASLRNTALVKFEVFHEGAFIPLEDNGASSVELDPDITPEITLRGTFAIEGGVPEDLRLWLDAEFHDLVVNGQIVAERRREKVIDPQNTVAPLARFCREGENHFTVIVRLSEWLSAKRGIRIHLGNLLKGCEPPVLLGNFLLKSPHCLAPVSGTWHSGDLAEQGFARFADELVLEQCFLWNNGACSAELALSGTQLPVAAELNGVPLGCRFWQNGTLPIPANVLKQGENVLKLRLCGEVWNLLERRWIGMSVQKTPFLLPEVKILF